MSGATIRPRERRIVLVSGAPGAGKTTVAIPLAAGLGLPLLRKDDIKETLWDALHCPPNDMEWSSRVGGAAMELLWRLAARCPAAILEANFRPRSEYERARIAGLNANVVEVYCAIPPDEAIRRYAARAGQRHAAHVRQTLSAEFTAEFDRPFGIGTVIEIDTTRPVDIDALVRTVRQALEL